MAGPSSWMKRGSNGKKPNYCLAKNSANLKERFAGRWSTRQRHFFQQTIFPVVTTPYKKKERTLCLDLRNCHGNITRNAPTVLPKLSMTTRAVSLAKTLQSACATC